MRCAKRLFTWFLPVAAWVTVSVWATNAALAGIEFTGSVSPSQTSDWNEWEYGYVGQNSSGTVTVTPGGDSALSSYECYLGGASWGYPPNYYDGVMTIDGAGATWTNTESIYVGTTGTGTVNIRNGGGVSVGGGTYVADSPNAFDDGQPMVGTINFGPGGGTLTTKMLWSAPSLLTGTGTIETRGLMSDMNITFDSGSSTTVALVGTGQNVTIHMNMSDSSNVGALGVGCNDSGSLTIQNGTVNSVKGWLGYRSGSTGTATIVGSGSTWNNVGDGGLSLFAPTVVLTVGRYGAGKLEILNGGAVHNTGHVRIASGVDSSGTITVDGEGSTLTVDGTFYIGSVDGGSVQSEGTLNILNHGVVEVTGQTIALLDGMGTINFGSNGGTLSTRGLWALPSQLTGTGTINTKGLVSDLSLTFDAPSKSFTFGNVDVTLNMSDWDLNNAGDLGIGYTDTGSITISGTTVNSNDGYLSYGAGTSGTVTVDGTNSTWRVARLIMGRGDQGKLLVTNGGTVNSGCVFFGTSNYSGTGGSGTAQVDGSGSTWTNDADMVIGSYHGDGALEITNGGTVHNGASVLGISNGMMDPNTYIGYTAGYRGTVTVDGSGSTFRNDGNLYVGYEGTGRLNITGGGAVTVSGTTTAGFDSGAGAYLNFSNGTLTTHMLYAKCQSTDLLGTGTINTRGLVSDANITFESTADHTFTIANNVTMNLNMSDSDNVADLGVGYRRDTGTLTIRNGVTVYSKNGYLGYGEYRDGVATVEGTDSAWINSEDLYVSRQGDGTLNIQNGGLVSAAGSTYVGSETGNGIIAFSGTGAVLSTKNLYIKPSKSHFTGAGTIEARGVVGDVNLTFDNTDQATVTLGSSVALNLDMSNSADPGDLGVSYTGTGSLMIQNGAKVYSANGYVAYDNGSSATATVTGSDSVWSLNGDLWLAGSDVYSMEPTGGAGTLNIANGGVVSVRKITQKSPWGAGDPSGIINFDGGTLQARAETDGFIDGLTHVYIKQGGATIDTNGYNVTMNQTLETDGVGTGGLTKIGDGTLTLRNASTYTGATVVEAGTLALDAAAQTVVLTGGGADIQGGKLVFNHSGGTVTGGQVWDLLDDSFDNNFTAGQIYSSTAQADDKALGWIDDGSHVTVMYTLYGDSNLDGSVNGSDLNAVLSYYNQSTDLVWGSQIWEHGDFNYDGSVNGSDLNTVLSNYNRSLSASTAAVPEPSTLLLMVLGVVGMLAWRKRFGIARRA